MSTRDPRPGPLPGIAGVALAAAGGLATDAAFPGRSWWPMAAVGVAALCLALDRARLRRAAGLGFVWGLAFFLPHLYWLCASVGLAPWIALTLTEAAFVAAFGAAWVVMRRAPLLRGPVLGSAAFAGLWVVVEQARSVFPFGGFPWGRLAFSQTDAPTVALAAIGGAPLVSAVVAAVGALLAQAVLGVAAALRHTDGDGRPHAVVATRSGLAAVALVAVGALVPLPTVGQVPPAAAAATGPVEGDETRLRVAAVQGNVARPGLDAFSHRLEVLRNHTEGTLAVRDQVGAGGVDLVLWPENAADVDPRVSVSARVLVEEAVEAIDAPILIGTLRFDEVGRYNDSLLWVPELGPTALYTKQHPAPFGEYIPMRDFARIFSDKVDLVQTDMLPGVGVGLVPVDVPRLERTVGVADVICFEVAYDSIVREGVRAGGEIIVIQTNNASFGPTQESAQQLAMTRFRAVEHGRTAIQVSTVGESGIFAPDGTPLATTELFTADQLVESVQLRSSLTVADRLGDWPMWVVTVLVVAALGAGLLAGRRDAARRRGAERTTSGAER